jgi:MFS family permease
VYGSAPTLVFAAAALVFVGLAYGYAFTSFAGIAQQSAPNEMRGRVLAVNSFVLGILYPVGTLVQGAIADVTSLRTVTIGSGVALAIVLAALLLPELCRSQPAQPVETDKVAGSQLLPQTTTITRSPGSGT